MSTSSSVAVLGASGAIETILQRAGVGHHLPADLQVSHRAANSFTGPAPPLTPGQASTLQDGAGAASALTLFRGSMCWNPAQDLAARRIIPAQAWSAASLVHPLTAPGNVRPAAADHIYMQHPYAGK